MDAASAQCHPGKLDSKCRRYFRPRALGRIKVVTGGPSKRHRERVCLIGQIFVHAARLVVAPAERQHRFMAALNIHLVPFKKPLLSFFRESFEKEIF
jgi:hypothetical protein